MSYSSSMASRGMVLFILGIVAVHGSENLSRRKQTRADQSSLYLNQTASYGIDGNTAQDEKNCSHTALNRSESAWYQVDLINYSSIERIKIYYRDEGKTWGTWRPFRFRQFYLFVSNTSASMPDKTGRYRCYKDNTSYPNYPSNVTDINCRQIARFIIVETEYYSNDTKSSGPVLEICEIEVYGCVKGFWGENCTEECNEQCRNKNCNPENGICVYGCEETFEGNKCEVRKNTTKLEVIKSDHNVTNMLVYTGIGIGGLLLLIVTSVSVVICRAKRKKEMPTDSFSYKAMRHSDLDINKMINKEGMVSVILQDSDEEPQTENQEETVYYNNLTVTNDTAVTNLLSKIKEKEFNENEGFKKEFKCLPCGERFDCTTAKLEENLIKNRFKTTFPYDHSRVKLSLENGITSDYINANFIKNMEGKTEYIACQGPKENTLIDHWRMIWQENVEYIVMLTNLEEGSTIKCHQYWPNKGQELDLGLYSASVEEERMYAHFAIKRMTLRKKRVSGSRTVVQFHYTQWSDHGTPNPLNFVVFHRHFRHKMKPTQHPIVVHCSAGVGRTGTFIAFDVLTRCGSATDKVNVIEYIKAMRKDRMTMIQNVDQFIFLYKALFEFFRRKGGFVKREDFIKCYSDSSARETRKRIADEFNRLSGLKPEYCVDDFKMGKKYLSLNSTKSVLPVDHHLVYLTSYVRGRDSYYNAVTLSSFTRPCEFISAQFPAAGAAIDLARLLVDQESHFLVSLNPLSGISEIKDWVHEEIKNFKLGPYEIIKITQSILNTEIRKTTLKIKEKKGKTFHTVHLYECLDWNVDDVLPADTSTLINLIKQFCLDRKCTPDGPVTLISIDGATCCGIFIAVYNAIEELLQDNEVDICTIVQQLQCCRPEMISTKVEYEFCYKAVSDFLNTDNVYANI